MNDTVFLNVSATADEIRVAFPDGNFQWNLEEPFTSTVPTCGNGDEGGVQLFRSVLGAHDEPWGLRTARLLLPSGALAELAETPWARTLPAR